MIRLRWSSILGRGRSEQSAERQESLSKDSMTTHSGEFYTEENAGLEMH
jgi:hypothetical protein